MVVYIGDTKDGGKKIKYESSRTWGDYKCRVMYQGDFIWSKHKLSGWLEHEFYVKFFDFTGIRLYMLGNLSLKRGISIGASIRRTQFKFFTFSLFGIDITLEIGNLRCDDDYDAHKDIYQDWWYDFDTEKEYTSPEKKEEVVWSKDRKHKYKDFFVSKILKIYTKDWLNCLYARSIELALPFFWYFKVGFKKPFFDRDWLGFNFILTADPRPILRVELMFLKHELKFVLGRNSLDRDSNMYSIKAIQRVLKLLPRNSVRAKGEYLTTLITAKKAAQLAYLLKTEDFAQNDFKAYLLKGDYYDYSFSHEFKQGFFDVVYQYLVQFDIPIENWLFETDIAPYAQEKLFKLRTQRINSQRAQYKFKFEDMISSFNDNYWTAKDDRTKGQEDFDSIVIDSKGNYVRLPTNVWIDNINAKGNIITYRMDENEPLRYSLYNSNGEFMKTLPYDTLSAWDPVLVCQNQKWGAIDDDGNEIIPLTYQKIEGFDLGISVAQKDGLYGVINLKNEIIIPFKYENLFILSMPDIQCFSAQKNGLWGVFALDGTTIIEPQYQALYFYNDFGVAKRKKKWGIINKENECLSGFVFNEVDVSVDETDYCDLTAGKSFNRIDCKKIIERRDTNAIDKVDVLVRIGKKYGMWSLNTGCQILEPVYNELGFFYDGLARSSRKKGDTRLVDRHGEEMVHWNEDIIDIPHEGFWRAHRFKRWNFVSVKNLDEVNETFKNDFDDVRSFSDGMAAVSVHNHWGYIDTTGNVVIPVIFDEASCFKNGCAAVEIEQYSGLIDKNGKIITLHSKQGKNHG